MYYMYQSKGEFIIFHNPSMNLDLIRTFVIVGQSKDFIDAASKLKKDKFDIKNLNDLKNISLIFPISAKK